MKKLKQLFRGWFYKKFVKPRITVLSSQRFITEEQSNQAKYPKELIQHTYKDMAYDIVELMIKDKLIVFKSEPDKAIGGIKIIAKTLIFK